MEAVITLSLLVIGILIYLLNELKGEIRDLSDRLLEQEDLHKEEIKKARQDSKFRSSAVNWGKAIEHFVPFTSKFPIPPEDVSFLGMPVDFVGFTETDDPKKCSIHFIEVKSGGSNITKKQYNIREAIKNSRVHWHTVRVDANNLVK
jgi:predicted Holliday junction resolvase-like endonuclease